MVALCRATQISSPRPTLTGWAPCPYPGGMKKPTKKPTKKKPEAAAVWMDALTLKPWDKNPRHNEVGVEALAKSLLAFGWGAPLVVQAKTNRIIAGHTRLKAWKWLQAHAWDDEAQEWKESAEGFDPVGCPTAGQIPVRVVDVTDEQADRLTIADNRTGELAGWNDDMLASALRGFQTEDVSWLFGLGFAPDEAAAILGEWEDPFSALPPTPGSIHDTGTSKVMVTVPVTEGHRVSSLIDAALVDTSIKYTIKVV